MRALFVSDVHGRADRYHALFRAISDERPDVVLLGGDLLPMPFAVSAENMAGDFLTDFLAGELSRLRGRLGDDYPDVLAILGNDDPRREETALLELEDEGLLRYAHDRRITAAGWVVYGYSYVPPTPFLLKDWERYDVSRYVDPGCVSPEEGYRSVPVPAHETRNATIKDDLERLAGSDDLDRSIFLFHSPPHETLLDRAALDGQMVDHVPLDVHVGSIAIRRFIERHQPLITLHGHVHESARLSGSWRDRMGRTHMFSAAHDGPELALVRFDPDDPEGASRELLTV
jgi:Icc-related predicted phosphoesterase